MSRMTKILIVAALGFIAVLHITPSDALNANGANVCPFFETSLVNVVRSYQEPYTQMYYTTCTDITNWFRCSRYRTYYRTSYRTDVEIRNEIGYKCCQGFRQVGQECQPCAENTWGPNCNVCTCQHEASCDPETGACTCTPGYEGISCSNHCPAGTYGSGCQSFCFCQNGAECNHVTGACTCAGYEPCLCTPNETGQSCTCLNGGQCHPETGTCTCPPGFTGEVCGEMCPRQRYGQDCQQHCQCFNQAHCNHVDGSCTCLEGWSPESNCLVELP